MTVKICKKLEIVMFAILLSISTGCSASFYDEQMKSIKRSHGIKGEPVFPDLKLNNSTILGIDSNKDGIRDDVEIWINDKFPKEKERREVRKFFKAKFKQLAIFHSGYEFEYGKDSPTKEALKKTVQDYTEVTDCLILRNLDSNLLNLLIEKSGELIYNTKERKKLEQVVYLSLATITYPLNGEEKNCIQQN